MPTHLSLPTFKQMIQKGDQPKNIALTKSQPGQPVAIEEASRKAVFTITTGSVDREQDVINLDGWQLDNFLKNPTVLWGHDQSALPIGRVTGITRTDSALKAEIEFCQADVNPMGEAVYQGVKQGFINATSVGFQPIEFELSDERTNKSRGIPAIDFNQVELLEVSLVNTPCNADALIDMRPTLEPTRAAKPTQEDVEQLDKLVDEIKKRNAGRKRKRLRTLFALNYIAP